MTELLKRGIWRAPWLGPHGEMVLLPIRSDHRLNEDPVIVPNGVTRAEASVAITERLDRDDPPRFRIIPPS